MRRGRSRKTPGPTVLTCSDGCDGATCWVRSGTHHWSLLYGSFQQTNNYTRRTGAAPGSKSRCWCLPVAGKIPTHLSAHLGACRTWDAPAAAAPQRHLSAIVSLTESPLCAGNDRRNLLAGGRPRDGDPESDRLLGCVISQDALLAFTAAHRPFDRPASAVQARRWSALLKEASFWFRSLALRSAPGRNDPTLE